MSGSENINDLYYSVDQLETASSITGEEFVEIIQLGKNVKIPLSELRGAQGATGKDAYGVALANGFVGNRTAWLESLKGVQGDVGPTGLKGDPGPGGLKGDQGPAGPQGPKGIDGANGVQGPKGDQGPAGPKGDTGPVGLQGPEGPQGFQGFRGDVGPKGDTGIQGIQGVAGGVGPRGIQGAPGKDGVNGLKGDKGNTGPQGPAGPAGTGGGGSVHYGQGEPDPNLGVDGDTYIDTLAQVFWERREDAWELRMNLGRLNHTGTITIDEVIVPVDVSGSYINAPTVPFSVDGNEKSTALFLNPRSVLRISGVMTYARNSVWTEYTLSGGETVPVEKNKFTYETWQIDAVFPIGANCRYIYNMNEVKPFIDTSSGDTEAKHAKLKVYIESGRWEEPNSGSPGYIPYLYFFMNSGGLSEPDSTSPAILTANLNYSFADASPYGPDISHLVKRIW